MTHCRSCQWKDTPAGCPFHIGPEAGIIEETPLGESRLMTGCFMECFFRVARFMIQTNASCAAATESARNEIADGLRYVGDAVKQIAPPEPPKLLPHLPTEE